MEQRDLLTDREYTNRFVEAASQDIATGAIAITTFALALKAQDTTGAETVQSAFERAVMMATRIQQGTSYNINGNIAVADPKSCTGQAVQMARDALAKIPA